MESVGHERKMVVCRSEEHVEREMHFITAIGSFGVMVVTDVGVKASLCTASMS